MTGDLVCSGGLHLQGHVNGKVQAASVTIGEPGRLNGELYADSVKLSGQFDGDLHCRVFQATHTATVNGRVTCASMDLQSGAVIAGEIVVSSAISQSGWWCPGEDLNLHGVSPTST